MSARFAACTSAPDRDTAHETQDDSRQDYKTLEATVVRQAASRGYQLRVRAVESLADLRLQRRDDHEPAQLCAWACFVWRGRQQSHRLLPPGVLSRVAFLLKQPTAIVTAPLAVYLWLFSTAWRRRANVAKDARSDDLVGHRRSDRVRRRCIERFNSSYRTKGHRAAVESHRGAAPCHRMSL